MCRYSKVMKGMPKFYQNMPRYAKARNCQCLQHFCKLMVIHDKVVQSDEKIWCKSWFYLTANLHNFAISGLIITKICRNLPHLRKFASLITFWRNFE